VGGGLAIIGVGFALIGFFAKEFRIFFAIA
jgi:hypothetical protein